PIRIVRIRKSGQVGDVFAKRLLSVYRQIRKRAISIELGSESCTGCLKVVEILLGPPVEQSALRIELTALIIEAMTDLVSNNSADRAIVVRVVGVGIEIWRLEDGGREVQSVLKREIDGIDGLRSHPPFVAVDGLVQLGQVTVVVEEFGTQFVT